MTRVDDLVAWLTQILDQRQRLYEHAPDFVEEIGSARGPGWGTAGGSECEVCGAWQFSGYESVVEDAWYEHMEQVHQRREVLARITADRQILALHEGGVSYPEDCGLCNESLPCATVRLLAQPYAARPNFRDEWRVTS